MCLFRISCVAVLLTLMGCANQRPYDYTNFREHPPRSILVLPPLNQSTAVEGTYGYLSTVTLPLAEMGYYVFPVAVIDQYLKENGMPTAGEMHEISLTRVREVTGADSVLFITLEQYGSKYQLINTKVTVQAKARLVDTRTGTLLWEGQGLAQNGSSGSGNILADVIAAAIVQAMNSKTDPAHNVSRQANANMFYTRNHGLLYGPYSPKYDKIN
jgi:hypothetical protein